MRRGVLAVIIASLFLLQPWMTTGGDIFHHTMSQSYSENQLFNQTGFYEDGTYTTSDGESHVSKPHIQWTSSNQGLVGINSRVSPGQKPAILESSLTLRQGIELIHEANNI